MIRKTNRAKTKQLPPILFFLPGMDSDPQVGIRRMRGKMAADPTPRVEFMRTGQLFHLFVDLAYVDSYLSPELSETYLQQLEHPRLLEAKAELEARRVV